MDFDEIIGQKQVITSLKRDISENRIGHAYIFSGPAGLGKKTIAHIFAGLLLCDNPKHQKACGKCRACMLYANGTNPDFRGLDTEVPSIGVDVIREIQKDAAIRPMYSMRKVYIVEDAGKMTEQAQNCLLKTFEEPPPYVVVILLADNIEMLLETVRSRARRLNFNKYTPEEVHQALVRKFGDSSDMLEPAVGYSDGNIGRAIELAGSGEFRQLRKRVMELLTGIAKGRMEDIMEFMALTDEYKDSADMLLDILLLYFRDMLMALETNSENMLINSDKKDIILSNARMYRSDRLLNNISAVEATRRALKQNANYQLAMDNMLVRLQEVG